jgi:excisionase family DNA binding protein
VSENHIQKPDDLSSTLDLLTVAETAAILNVSQKTVSTWVHQGALPAVKLGSGKRLIRVRRCDLEDFISQGEIADPPSGRRAMSCTRPTCAWPTGTTSGAGRDTR